MEMKEYMTPEMEVVKLQQQTALLAGSSTMDETDGNDPNNPTPGPF